MRKKYGSRTGGNDYTGNTGWGTTGSYGSSWNTQGEEQPHDYSWKNHIYEQDFRNLGGNIPEEEADSRQGTGSYSTEEYGIEGNYADSYDAGGNEIDSYGKGGSAGRSYRKKTGNHTQTSDRFRRRTGSARSRAEYRNSEAAAVYPEDEIPYEDAAEEGAEQISGYAGDPVYQGDAQTTMFNRATLMKFIAVFLILVYVMFLLIYTSGSTKSFQEVAGAIEDSLDKESLLKQDTQALKRYYGLNSADYEGVLLYSAEFSISAEEVLMIETKNEQQVQEVQDAIDERLESRMNTFEGYAPEQVQLLEEAQIQVRGNFIFLAVSVDAENYASVFTKAL